MTYQVRKVCETETDGKSFHYFYENQEIINEEISCPDHAEAVTRDFVIVEEIE